MNKFGVSCSPLWMLLLLFQCLTQANQVFCQDSLALYPRATETRDVLSLDGVWHFKITNYSYNNQDYGFEHKWYLHPLSTIEDGTTLQRMPVPSSYNDITESREIRDFSGWVWYDRNFFVSNLWHNTGEVLLRFGSVNYQAVVYVNGHYAMNHTGGHLPFQTNVTSFLRFGAQNRITVAVNNQLTADTLPSGSSSVRNDSRVPGKTFVITKHNFDFFNYAGIQRSVVLYRVPSVRIVDITISTDVTGPDTGLVTYLMVTNGANTTPSNKYIPTVTLFPREGNSPVAQSKGAYNGTLNVKNATLWWPFTMHSKPGYLYRMVFQLFDSHTQNLVDSYSLNVGIRSIKVNGQNQFLVNNKPFYFRGFGKHEEYNIRGRSLDPVMILKDFNLIKWIGANSFRTSHYPYSEELMDEADAQGIAVIDECPAVGLAKFDNHMLQLHLTILRELIDRDKNRPSVFMWSLANEPQSFKPESEAYFKKVRHEVDHLNRFTKVPVTGAVSAQYNADHMAPSLDVIMINRYFAWYSDTGYVQVIQNKLVDDFHKFRKRFNKPLMVSEYGADTISGMHTEPSFIFSEDYQSEYLIEHHKAFDVLRGEHYLVGEHIWNFADFMTDETTTRVGGNKKGIFTRDRQPKASARLLRCRYWNLSNDTGNPYRKGFSYCPQVNY